MKYSGSFFTVLLVILSSSLFSQNKDQIKQDFVKAFKTGESSHLQKYFEGFVGVNIPGTIGLYTAARSKSQLQEFLKKHPAGHFSLEETGFTGENYFLIGSLWYAKKKWNVYFLMAPKNGSYHIQQIEIEEMTRP